jgi:hypothetical protein
MSLRYELFFHPAATSHLLPSLLNRLLKQFSFMLLVPTISFFQEVFWFLEKNIFIPPFGLFMKDMFRTVYYCVSVLITQKLGVIISGFFFFLMKLVS